MRQTIIIGSGPAGYTAGIYASRANLDPLLIASSVEAGGELVKTTEVENFPGFQDGVQGPDLMAKIQAQAERFGTEVVLDDVVDLQVNGDVKRVTLGNGDVHEALTVIFATGSAYRKLNIPDEERLSGHGVSWCATCDGFFFRRKTIAVVGGGDSAMEDATFLTRFADKVYVIHRGPGAQLAHQHAWGFRRRGCTRPDISPGRHRGSLRGGRRTGRGTLPCFAFNDGPRANRRCPLAPTRK